MAKVRLALLLWDGSAESGIGAVADALAGWMGTPAPEDGGEEEVLEDSADEIEEADEEAAEEGEDVEEADEVEETVEEAAEEGEDGPPTPPRGKVTEKEVEGWMRRLAAGDSVSHIAKRAGVAVATVYRRVKEWEHAHKEGVEA